MELNVKSIKNDVVVQKNVEEVMATISLFIKPEFQIQSKEQAGQVTDTIKALNNNIKMVDEKRMAITKPINEGIKILINEANEVKEPMINAVGVLKPKVVDYSERQRVAQEKEERRLKALEVERLEKEKAEIEEQAYLNNSDLAISDAIEKDQEIEAVKETPMIKINKGVKTSYSSGHTRDNWKFEIKDESKIPRMFMMPDEKAIRGFVIAKKDKANIDGIRIWNEKTAVIR